MNSERPDLGAPIAQDFDPHGDRRRAAQLAARSELVAAQLAAERERLGDLLAEAGVSCSSSSSSCSTCDAPVSHFDGCRHAGGHPAKWRDCPDCRQLLAGAAAGVLIAGYRRT